MKAYIEKDIKFFKTVFEQDVAGTYSVDLPAGDYLIEMYGGGGGVSGYTSSGTYIINGGGSGAGFKAIVTVTEGTYSIVVGEGGTGRAILNGSGTGDDGTDSTFGTLITCGGGTKGKGTGGNVTLSDSLVVKQLLKKQSGVDGGTASKYAVWVELDSGYSTYDWTHYGYGAGGWWYGEGEGTDTQNGLDGYVKIEHVGTADDYTTKIESAICKLPTKTVSKHYDTFISGWSQPILSSNSTIVKEGKIVCTASSDYGGNTGIYKIMLGAVSSTIDNGYWQVANSTADQWLQIKFPYKLKITALSVYSRPGDNYSGTVTAYTDSTKSVQIGNSITTAAAKTKYTFLSGGTGIVTDTIYLYITNLNSSNKYYGLQNLNITAKKIEYDVIKTETTYYGMNI